MPQLYYFNESKLTKNISWVTENLLSHYFAVYVFLMFFEKYTGVLGYVSESQAKTDAENGENIRKYVKK